MNLKPCLLPQVSVGCADTICTSLYTARYYRACAICRHQIAMLKRQDCGLKVCVCVTMQSVLMLKGSPYHDRTTTKCEVHPLEGQRHPDHGLVQAFM